MRFAIFTMAAVGLWPWNLCRAQGSGAQGLADGTAIAKALPVTFTTRTVGSLITLTGDSKIKPRVYYLIDLKANQTLTAVANGPAPGPTGGKFGLVLYPPGTTSINGLKLGYCRATGYPPAHSEIANQTAPDTAPPAKPTSGQAKLSYVAPNDGKYLLVVEFYNSGVRVTLDLTAGATGSR